MNNYQKTNGYNDYQNGYAHSVNWNQRQYQGNNMNSNQQSYGRNNINDYKGGINNRGNINNQKNQNYQQHRGSHNQYQNGIQQYQQYGYQNNRNYEQQYYQNNSQYNDMYNLFLNQQNQNNNYGHNQMMASPNNGADMSLQMWDMNTYQSNLYDQNSQNYPSLTQQFPHPVYVTNNGIHTNINGIDLIPDSSEFEKRLIEDQMKQQTKNSSSNTPSVKTNQNTQITDVNMLFSQMNALANGKNTGEDKENQIMLRTKQGVYIIDYTQNGKLEESSKISAWNSYSFFIQDGHYIICADSCNIGVYSTTKKKLLDHKKMNDIQDLILSPLQKFLVCIEKPDSSDNIKLQILDALNLQSHKEIEYNYFSKSKMNLILFDKNENQIFIREKKEIKIFNTTNFEQVNQVNAENFIYQYISPSSDQQQLLLLTPEYSKGYEMIPAQLKLYNLNNLSTCILDKSISKSQEIIPVWSPNGKHLLIWCSTIKDDTGNTYYGQHIVYKYNPEKQSIEQLNFYKGVIHNIQWQPTSEHFVIIGGGMPSHSVLFNKDGIPLYEFGRHHINKVKWSPYSKLLFLSGFGNLGGDIEVWNVEEFKKLGQFKAHCTVSSEWSYDGTKILCGVLFPKLRVQNNFKIFDVFGTLCKYSDYSQTDLYQVSWHPYPFPEEKPISQKKPTSPLQNLIDQENKDKNSNLSLDKPKKGILTKRGNLSSMLNQEKISNHGGKVLQPDETFAREEDKEMEIVKQNTTQKKQDQGIMFQRNKNKFVDQPKPPTEEEEKAQEREKKQIKLQQKTQYQNNNNNNSPQQYEQNKKQNDKNQFDNNNYGKGITSGGRLSPELDDFFDKTDDVNEQDRLNIQAIAKKNGY